MLFRRSVRRALLAAAAFCAFWALVSNIFERGGRKNRRLGLILIKTREQRYLEGQYGLAEDPPRGVIVAVTCVDPLKNSSDLQGCPHRKMSAANVSVPNHLRFVHLVHKASERDISVVAFLAIVTAYLNQRPDEITLHTNLPVVRINDLKDSKNLSRLKKLLSNFSFVIERTYPPPEIYGTKLESPRHQLEVLKLLLALERGGVFSDPTVFLVRNASPALFREELTFAGDEESLSRLRLFAAKPGARFVRMWLETYLQYNTSSKPWYKFKEHPVRALLPKCRHLYRRELDLLANAVDVDGQANVDRCGAVYVDPADVADLPDSPQAVAELETPLGLLAKRVLERTSV